MSKINIKNYSPNELLVFIRQFGIRFETKQVTDDDSSHEEITFFPRNNRQREDLLAILETYGTKQYHNTTIENYLSLHNFFNYSSNEYERTVLGAQELELPLYYIENENDQNERFKSLKSLNTNAITKSFIDNISDLQGSLNAREQSMLLKMRNIVFGNDFQKVRSKKFLDEFCYYNRIQIKENNSHKIISPFLKTINFQEEFLSAFLSDNNFSDFIFSIDNSTEETRLSLQDALNIINNGSYQVDESNKLVLSTQKKNSSHISNNFKKFLLINYLEQKKRTLLRTFGQMYNNEECPYEHVIYRVEKFIDTDTSPIQTFWMFEEEWKEYFDYQIKRDATYRYELKAHTIIYGTQSQVIGVTENRNNIKANFFTFPSYKVSLLEYDSASIKVSPKIPTPPCVEFLNESNAKNYIKIYLDLKASSKKEPFIQITEEDALLIQNIPTDEDGNVNFEYSVQDGKFEVFRLDEMPKSYADFENAKVLDVRNKRSSTSVVFKHNLLPNKKYYYMFRAKNFINVPSNPTPVYEIELIKDASSSKIMSRTISLQQEQQLDDKSFKSLLQIKPAFQQEVFNDQDPFVQELDTFKKNINDLTLGTATDKLWGKKFKIRVKSKDTGKIIDLNVKFNLIKDNI